MASDQNLLVTGAGGQLGKALRRLAPGSVFLDRSALDVTDADAVDGAIREHAPKVIVHAAAYTKVDDAERNVAEAEQVNIEATRHIANASEASGSVLVYPSTDYVFDGTKERYKESDETGPKSVYGRTKLEGERISATVTRHLIVRTSWVFGDGHNFIRSILNASVERDELTIVDDQRGRPTYALDLAEGILKLVSSGAHGLLHLTGGGEPCTWADLAEEALRIAGSTTKVRRISTDEYLSMREGEVVAPRPAFSVLDCSKASKFGVVLRPWPQAVSEYVREIV